MTAFVTAGLVDSNGDARRQIKGGGLKVNDQTVSDDKAVLKTSDLKEGAIVVSLKCLMGSGRAAARERSSSPALKERNVRLFRSI